MSTIQLGVKVKDEITGFNGVATGRCQYLTGCDQYLVQPPLNAEGAFVESRWLDVQRLSVMDESAITLDNSDTPGADAPAPRK